MSYVRNITIDIPYIYYISITSHRLNEATVYMYPNCMDCYIAMYHISIYEQYEKEN